MTTKQIMKLVDDYAKQAASEGDYFSLNDDPRSRTAKARAAVVAALDALTKDAARYRVGREAEYAGLMPTFRVGKTWAEAMDSAYDAAIAAQKEQV